VLVQEGWNSSKPAHARILLDASADDKNETKPAADQ
jgi:hypothetical protein